MSNLDQILEAAKKLGTMISDHEAAKKLDNVIRMLKDDTDAQRLLNDYNRQIQTVAEKESKGQPIEVQDKHKLEELQKKVVRDPFLRDLQMAQMDYADLMRRVDEAIQGTSPLPASGPTTASPLSNPDLSRSN